RRGEGLVEEPVEGPQESGQGLARAGGGADQGVVTGGDRLPAAALGWRRSGEARLESGPRGGGEAVEDGHSAERIPGAGQPKGRAQVQQVSSPEGRAASTFSQDRKSTRLNSSHVKISYAVFCLKKKNN